MEKYDHAKIEKKWQDQWQKSELYRARESSPKKKFYCLIEFPYPSGEGLHVGHIRSYTALDIVARRRRMAGENVLYPIGWDAFGLPTENFAIKTGRDPREVTRENTANFRRQIQSLGLSFDWAREINTSDPEYYRWTQWIFLQLFKKGLAYKKKTLINWCPQDKIGLANEEVVGGLCERCGAKVERREKEQWLLAITRYADRLIDDLDKVDYPEAVKTQQKNWIGRREGVLIKFGDIEVFTTRPETIYGATFIAVAGAEDRFSGNYVVNPINQEKIPVWEAEYVMGQVGTGAIMGVPAYDERDFEFAKKHDLPIKEVVVPNIIDRRNPPVPGKKTVERKNVHAIVRDPKTAKYLGLKWKNYNWTTFPMGGISEGEDAVTAARREVKEETGFVNLKLVKVIRGQVRAEYFAAHKDENRVAYTTAVLFELIDYEQVAVDQKEKDSHEIIWLDRSELNYEHLTHAEADIWNERLQAETAYTGEGTMVNSGEFNGLTSEAAREEVVAMLDAEKKVTYRLRDWIFSRQRYWGEPIPLIFCEKCGWMAVPENELPLVLPPVKNYQPREDGESPLASLADWINVKCPNCGGPAWRETDTMPNWAGSSWYYLRYIDPHNGAAPASPEKLKHWLPVDWYNGGMEHTNLHLLYSRFWHKFLFDSGVVPTEEPYRKRTSHGLILAADGEKMSKSRGNVVNPDEIITHYGADTLRLYLLFLGPFTQAVVWSAEGLIGPRRFLERVWRLSSEKVTADVKIEANDELARMLNLAVKKISADIETMSFNTAVSQLMILVNVMQTAAKIARETWGKFLLLLAPFAPHLAEELWSRLGEEKSVHLTIWPEYIVDKSTPATFTIIVQVNGVRRDSLKVPAEMNQEEVEKMALHREKVSKWVDKRAVKKVVYVKGRLLNFVV